MPRVVGSRHRPLLGGLRVMRFGILGPFEIADDQGRELVLGGGRQPRAVLAILLLHANEVVSMDRLIEELWGERPPATAAKTIQVYVSQLRKALGRESVVTHAPGYLIRVGDDELDLRRFEALVAQARPAPPDQAAMLLREALQLWRGPPLAEFMYDSFAQPEIKRLDELRLEALEERMDADLALGRHSELVAELERSVADEPLRERLRSQLMLALYRCGRQADALAAYSDARRALVEELGIEPSPRLRDLERAILCQDPALEPPPPATVREAPPSPVAEPPPREGRKTVTFLCSDLVDSTGLSRRLDPEALQRLMSRYFTEMRAVLESHSGTVEKYFGDAVVAIFGVPVVHEDDALRAVRAAAGMRDAVTSLNQELEPTWGVRLAIRIGVSTGEVIAGDRSQHQLVATGPAVNVAKRLEEAAENGEILISQATYRLVSSAVRAEPVATRSWGDAGAIDAIRLVEVLPGVSGRARRFDSPLVGRTRQLEALSTVFRNAMTDCACHLYTVLGSAGVGKSRLVREFVEPLGDGVTVLSGRCLPYGDGITYWPLADALRELASSSGRSGAELSVETIAGWVAGEPKAQLIAERVAAVLGVGAPVAGGPEETFWAVRKLLEALARSRPLVVVFDDLHWAEPTFLDLVEHIADYSPGSPILILCMARPELLDERPGWSGGKLNSTSVLLEALTDDECAELIANLRGSTRLSAKSERRIVKAAEGNPLFAEELLAMLVDRADVRHGRRGAFADLSQLAVPPTIQALLAARLELLPDDERALVELASVEGAQFHRGALSELAPSSSELSVDRSLMALVRRDVIRPDRASFAGEQAFRFRHVLIRDAAYESLRKETRAELHERFAAWLERIAGTRLPEFEEIVGYHLELAHRYRRVLRVSDADAEALAMRASERLESAGRRALRRNDLPTALGLLERAAKLPGDDDARQATLLVDLAATQIEGGRLTRAKPVLLKAGRLATNGLDACVCAHVDVQRQLLQLEVDTGQGTTEGIEVVERVLPVFRQAGDHLGLCRALRLRAHLYWIEARADAAAGAWEEAAEQARLAGAERERIEILTWVASSLFFGPTHRDSAIVRCEQLRAEVSPDVAAEAATLHPLAGLHAMGGRFALARELLATSRALLAEIDPTLNSAVSHPRAIVEMLAGEPAAAEASLKADSETLDEMKDKSLLSTTDAFLAQAILAQGRYEEAERYTRLSEQRAAADDLITQIIWRSVRARILATRGRLKAAESLARYAVSLAAKTDFLSHHADALLDLAHILQRAGRREEANASAIEALSLYEQKGNSVAGAAARSLLAQLSQRHDDTRQPGTQPC